ncbi:hypothetical protein MSAN_00752100 [Mycena sanguinolenta]|uniref:Uncharacterized protein n=1 Tax=Mycena sanguinolenta TaxID=230812 RepID=A0A8H6Z7D7_9AGAR|nr:hypothetical protein MSAN_00752100 [Mycena sanguinolenta]
MDQMPRKLPLTVLRFSQYRALAGGRRLYNQPSSFAFHPPSHLTRYEFEATLTMHRSIWEMAPNLVEAHILIKDDDFWSTSEEISLLASLCRLYVSHGKILDYVRAPALVELGFPLGTTGRPYLESFLARSSCTLQRLCIPDGIEFSPHEFNAHETLAVLNMVSTLIELRIIISNSSRQVNVLIAELTASDAGTNIVAPHLSCISFAPRPWLPVPFDYEAYVQMTKSRWESQQCALIRTELCMTDSTPIRSLDLLRENGLQFMLWTGLEATKITGHWICSCTLD